MGLGLSAMPVFRGDDAGSPAGDGLRLGTFPSGLIFFKLDLLRLVAIISERGRYEQEK
jgi:hypothetical protein